MEKRGKERINRVFLRGGERKKEREKQDSQREEKIISPHDGFYFLPAGPRAGHLGRVYCWNCIGCGLLSLRLHVALPRCYTWRPVRAFVAAAWTPGTCFDTHTHTYLAISYRQ